MYSESDILDQPELPKEKPKYKFALIYIELSFIVFFGVLVLNGFSLLAAPIFVFCMLIYAAVAPFIKPQFTKDKSLKIALGIWNSIQIIILGLGFFFIIQSLPGISRILVSSLLSLSIYYLVLPFTESQKIKSLRFLTLLFFGLGFSILFIGVAFKLNSWAYSFFLLTMGPILVGFSALMMLFQLAKDNKTHYYYWFYLPRITGLLISWITALSI